jgi:hypothetical protein
VLVPRKTGHIPDPPAIVSRRNGFHLYRARARLGAAALPLLTTNRAWLPADKGGPGILQQAQTSSCTGHASAGAGTSRFSIAQTPVALLSPIQPYWGGITIDRGAGAIPGVPMPVLVDNGAEPSQVVRAVMEDGWVKATTWGNFPADPATITKEGLVPTLDLAAEFELQGAYFLPDAPGARILDLLTALAAGEPVTQSVQGGCAAFQNYTGGVLTAATLTGDLDHYTYAIDYAFSGTPAEWATFTSALAAGDATAYTALLHFLSIYHVNSWGEDPENGGWGEADAVSGLKGGFYRSDGTAIVTMADFAVWDVTPSATSEVLQ